MKYFLTILTIFLFSSCSIINVNENNNTYNPDKLYVLTCDGKIYYGDEIDVLYFYNLRYETDSIKPLLIKINGK